jgi:hypothetical protein
MSWQQTIGRNHWCRSPTPTLQQDTKRHGYLVFLTARSVPTWGLVEVVRVMLTEYAVEMGLSEQQLRRSTSFIIGILSRG